MAESRAAARLRQQIERLLQGQSEDGRLRDNLEGLAHDEALPGLTWFWGPLLYERNRVVFRGFILNHFSEWAQERFRWKRVSWSAHQERLEAWLDAARKHRDSNLVRRLLRWKFAGSGWGIDHAAWNAALRTAYQAAAGPAARSVVLDEYDDWFELDEDTALALYRTDTACGPFLLRHLRRSFWGDDKRKLWARLATVAQEARDEEFYWSLYRRQIPIKLWRADVVAVADRVGDGEALCTELERRHPEGFGLDLGGALVELLEKRGRDAMPYVRAKLADVVGRWYGTNPKPFVKLARRKGWWDLWAAVIRVSPQDDLFNEAVAELLADESIHESERLARLRALAGVSREWNWAGFGLARVHELKDDLAVKLYHRYPDLVHGPYKPHITPRWWRGYPKLLAAAQAAADEDLVDLMASRYATRFHHEHAFYGGRERNRIIETADSLGEAYQAIRDRDPALFARRAANVLTQIPAYSIFAYPQVLRTNKLARLLFVRSFDAFLSVPEAVRDLVEGSDIHVQMLAYRVLAVDDDRARALAVDCLDILLGTLLRPLHRKTRLAAFGALANAARADAEAGARIHRRARDALRLPDKKYPKEELIGLIGQILHVRPELRGPRETPLVYGLEAAAP